MKKSEPQKQYETGKQIIDGFTSGIANPSDHWKKVGDDFMKALKSGMDRAAEQIKEYQAMLTWLSSGEDSPEKRCVRRMIERENKRRSKEYKIRSFIDKLKFWNRNKW